MGAIISFLRKRKGRDSKHEEDFEELPMQLVEEGEDPQDLQQEVEEQARHEAMEPEQHGQAALQIEAPQPGGVWIWGPVARVAPMEPQPEEINGLVPQRPGARVAPMVHGGNGRLVSAQRLASYNRLTFIVDQLRRQTTTIVRSFNELHPEGEENPNQFVPEHPSMQIVMLRRTLQRMRGGPLDFHVRNAGGGDARDA